LSFKEEKEMTPAISSIAKKVDPSKGWWKNSNHFQEIMKLIVAEALKAVPLQEQNNEFDSWVREYCGDYLVSLDELYNWDFPNMSDSTEDFFLRIYGKSYAYFLLRNKMKLFV
jgi:hypothetical protein